jgi:hypothetical protein
VAGHRYGVDEEFRQELQRRSRWNRVGLRSIECKNLLCCFVATHSSKIRKRSFNRWRIQVLASWRHTRRCIGTGRIIIRRRITRWPPIFSHTLVCLPFAPYTLRILLTTLGLVVPCIFKYSNKNTQPDATINRKIYCLVA